MRMPSLTAVVVLVSASAVTAAISCLPKDSRPPPDELDVKVEPSPDTVQGFPTDGWEVHFDRVLVGVGDVGLRGDSCTDYAGDIGVDSQYDRLVDPLQGKQKLANVFGLGTCDVRFRMNSPADNAVLGPGVTGDDLAFMRTLGTDRYSQSGRGPGGNGNGSAAGTALYVEGRGVHAGDGHVKRFKWQFRKRLQFRDCGAPADAGLTTRIDLPGGGVKELDLTLHIEELFRAENITGAPLRFSVIAAADANGDDLVTLDELHSVVVADVDALADAGIDVVSYDATIEPDSGDAGPGPGQTTLDNVIYNKLLPRVTQVGDQVCVSQGRRQPD